MLSQMIIRNPNVKEAIEYESGKGTEIWESSAYR